MSKNCISQSLAKLGINFLKIWSPKNDTKNTNRPTAINGPLNSLFAGANNQSLLTIRPITTIMLNADTILSGVSFTFNLLSIFRFKSVVVC